MIIDGRDVRVVAVDFDGTLFTEDKYPAVGDPIEVTINYVKYLKSHGVELILWTCREGKILEDAVEACKSVGIEFDAINQNLQWRIDKYNYDCRKIGADLYIDDKAFDFNHVAEWKDHVCSKCGEFHIDYSHNADTLPFLSYHTKPYCPNCGRYMLNHTEN